MSEVINFEIWYKIKDFLDDNGGMIDIKIDPSGRHRLVLAESPLLSSEDMPLNISQYTIDTLNHILSSAGYDVQWNNVYDTFRIYRK